MYWKYIPALLSFGGFIIFAFPLSMKIINIGNAAGMLVTGLLTALFLFWERFVSFVSGHWEKLPGRVFLIAAAVLAAVCIISASVLSVFMARAANDPPQSENTTLIVLGCQVKKGRPSRMLRRRLDAAYGYLSEHGSACAVVSGGKGDNEEISEAQCMRDYLVSRGISPERIYMEDRSTSTEENLLFSKKLIESKGLSGDTAIVTDAYHQLRAHLIAESFGLESGSISGYTSWYLVPTFWVREWFGTVYYLAK